MNDKLKGALKSKVMWAAFAYAVLNALLLGFPVLQPFVNAKLFAYINFSFTGIVAALRWFTTQALENK